MFGTTADVSYLKRRTILSNILKEIISFNVCSSLLPIFLHILLTEYFKSVSELGPSVILKFKDVRTV